MVLLERGLVGAVLLLAGFAHADAPGYGKVETFQPGKKYNCVPTADHKAWDCNESGKSGEPHIETATPPAPAPSTDTAVDSAPKASALPSYLKNSAVSGQARGATAAPAPEPARAPAQAPAPTQVPAAEPARARTTQAAAMQQPPAPAQTPAAGPTQVPAAEPARAPATPAAATQSAPATPTAAVETAPPATNSSTVPTPLRSNREFLALPASSYIVEIAHSANRADLAALHANLHVPIGELYELRLTRDGADWWLLVWGVFSDIESARAARSDLPADPAVNAGWPRRIAPLQAEARRFD